MSKVAEEMDSTAEVDETSGADDISLIPPAVLPPQKTPISRLEEYCSKQGITAKYDMINIDGPVHKPVFIYRVTVGDDKAAATGSGSSKKNAKHAAAQNALDLLAGKPQSHPVTVSGQQQPTHQQKHQQRHHQQQKVSARSNEADNDDLAAADTAREVLGDNHVGSLQQLTMNRRWPPPEYSLDEERGQPHEREFIVSVTVNGVKECGVGRSKKLAKKHAAYKMLKKLEAVPKQRKQIKKESLVLDDTLLNVGLNDKEKALARNDYTSLAEMTSVMVAKLRGNKRAIQIRQMKFLDWLRNQSHNEVCEYLEKTCQEIGISAPLFIDIGKQCENLMYMCTVSLDSAVVMVGTDVTPDSARSDASFNVLDYFHNMLLTC